MATIKRITLRWAATHAVYLGRRGENLARTIEIDATPMAEEFPGCTFALLVQRPTEAYAYATTVTEADGIVSWPITDVDTGIAGSGRIELRAMLGDVVAKSVTMATVTDKSLDAPTDTDPPEPEHGWLDQALAAQAGAEAAAADAKETLATVEQKLADGELKGEKGDPGKDGKDGKDAEVTAENIETALGYKPIKDVQVAGTSVLADGVAKVPIAGKNAPGVLCVDDYTMGMTANNNIFLYGARKRDIDARSTNIAIDPNRLDYAVKAAMCDGKGAAWTSAEQQAARNRMGLDTGCELIEEITLTNAASVVRANEPDGTPYRLRKLFILFISPGANTDTTVNQSIYVDDEKIYNYGVKTIGANAGAESIIYAEVANNLLGIEQVFVRSKSGSVYEANTPRTARKVVAGDAITQVDLGTMPSGTIIKIYGVRA